MSGSWVWSLLWHRTSETGLLPNNVIPHTQHALKYPRATNTKRKSKTGSLPLEVHSVGGELPTNHGTREGKPSAHVRETY